ncbi:MAG: hypothetical protein C4538_05325 [Nitrospiraceae bacterium]|nr:MAG: hypothetical protein C4538_05325 [Nitrospiraceae bacterium]
MCIFILPASVAAKDAEFIYPFNNAVTFISKIRIIGKTGDSQNLSLSAENSSGKKRLELELADNYFSCEVQLALGKNTVSLSNGSGTINSIEILFSDRNPDNSYPEGFSPYYLHSKNDLAGECRLCHPVNENYKAVSVQQPACMTKACHADFDNAKFQHEPFQKGSCASCHNPHGSENKDFLKYVGSALCFSCHAEAEKMSIDAKHIHHPVLKGECTSCHDPHQSNLEYHLKRESIVGLCSGCHGKEYNSHNVLHEPVKAGDCIACHMPHVSQSKKLLLDSGNNLCFKCHKERKAEFENTFIHEPVKKDCTICHDPHGSETLDHLRNRKDENGNYIPVKQPIKELCLDCHRKLDPEFANQIENGKYRHDPVDKTECTSCHTPHSTNNKQLMKLPISDVCYSCHPKEKELITGSLYKHGPVRTDDCGQCHLVHGSENKHLLRTSFSEEYAIKFDAADYSLCYNCHNSELILEKDTRTTGFRNGKENLHYLHVVTKGKSCKTCHEIHASNQAFHIREKIPYNDIFTITLKFTKLPDGGSCMAGCHKAKKYDRIRPEKNE